MGYSQLLRPAHNHRYLQSNAVYYFTIVALSATIILAIISWMKLCSQACAEGHQYRLYGFTFEMVGLVAFPTMLLSHIFSRSYPALMVVTGWMLAAALGAEVMFIYVQKYKIGSWCPVCLLIASALVFAAIAYFYEFCYQCKQSIQHEDRGNIMQNIFKGLSTIIVFIAGFLIAFSGIGKYNALQAAESDIKDRIAFGNPNSTIEVFIFTDWACPGCRALEPTLEALLPNLMKRAKVTFVDDPVHPATLNYSPYNLSFMINNKQQYLNLRNDLVALSEDTKSPTDGQVEEIARKYGLKYNHLNYADVALATKYFNHLVDKLEVEGTPTIVIVSKSQKKGKKLEGTGEISEESVMKALNSIK